MLPYIRSATTEAMKILNYIGGEFLEPVDTLAEATDSSVSDIRKAEAGPLGVRVYLGENGSFQMYDGTSFSLENKSTPEAQPVVKINGKEWTACKANQTENCFKPSSSNKLEVFVTTSKGFALTGHKGAEQLFSFKVANAPKARNFVVMLWW